MGIHTTFFDENTEIEKYYDLFRTNKKGTITSMQDALRWTDIYKIKLNDTQIDCLNSFFRIYPNGYIELG